MPNTPEAAISFYAVNKIGAIANMLHPLSAEEEIKHSLISTNSVMLIAINLSYAKVKNINYECKESRNPDTKEDEDCLQQLWSDV